jgi:hypothetical protein
MHFNIYLDDKTGAQLSKLAAQGGQTRNALIREAIQIWLQQQLKPEWPKEILNFTGIKNYPAFEDHRKKLTPPKEDPFA